MTVNSIAKWDGSGWSPLGSGRSGIAFTYNFGVRALAAHGTDIYAGGQFDTAGGVTVNNIAKWDGSGWSPLGSGMNDADVFTSGVFALAVSGTDAYAGGKFTTAGGVKVNNIAKWNGTNWSALGTGMDYAVNALAVSGTDVYAGGWFTTAGGVPANHIAKWDGTSWSALGTGMDGQVSALAVIGTDVYAGGDFTTAGGVAVNCIAKWNGTNWSALETGMNGSVSALAVSGTDVYAGGRFTTAGGLAANRIAKWDGSIWTSLGSGISSDVYALTVSGTYVYAGGYFTTAGGLAAKYIAKWDGKAWSALGSGVNNGVKAVAVNGADICCGGWFGVAGDKVSSYFAIWHSNNLVLTSPNGGEIWEAGTAHAVTWLSQPTVGNVKIEYSTDGGGSWTTIAASTPNHGSYDWLAPGVNSANALVRVSDAADGDPSDTSDAVFSIVTQPTIVVKSPNGGERWIRGSSHNIIWSSTLDVGNVKIEYSTDNGTTYTTIAASTANTGNYLWTVPNNPSPACRIRISQVVGGVPIDASDGTFTILPFPPTISLSRAQLRFGAVLGGMKTDSQKVLLRNSGSGQLNWTAISDQTWLTVTPGSGTEPAVLSIGIDPASLAAGFYNGHITVSDPSATNNPLRIDVSLWLKRAGISDAPFGYFDTPVNNTIGIAGAIPVTGWALDDIEVAKVEIKRDPVSGDPPGAKGPDGLVYIVDATFVEGARPDVEQAISSYPLSYRAGWGYMLLTNFLPGQGNGSFKLYAIATDMEGNKVTLGTKMIGCSNATAVKPFGAIDSPAQGGDALGNSYWNFGWVLTPLTKTVPKNGSTILVYVDGAYVGNLSTAPNVYNQYRADVSEAFPGLNNTGAPGVGGPVGAYFLDTTTYPNGVHTIAWVATDDGGATDGIGSRYFNVINTGASAVQSYTSDRHREERSDAAISKIEDIFNLPLSFDALSVKREFNLTAPPEKIVPDNFGNVRVEMREVERLEISFDSDNPPSPPFRKEGELHTGVLSTIRYKKVNNVSATSILSGHQVVGSEPRPLPIGSTLDQRNGTFSWLPGPGFLGTYDLLFLLTDELGIMRRIPVKITIRPKFEKD